MDTILDPDDTKIYEAHYGMTQEWAAQLTGLGWDPELVLGYDRTTGGTVHTLGELASSAAVPSLPETHGAALRDVSFRDQ